MSDAELAEVDEANERLSHAMLNDYQTVETPVVGGLISSQTFVRCTYNDLRIVLAFVDKLAAALRARAQGGG